ncbi:hypothetical protein JTE90_019930 [Oedothorax gibbosus]|uniref:Uncharacterized protein n=1 Tax=Oedothorax gibbosus TaxID=931172 RepID=A0AAV6US71_9ARAC|nr:hypothetical protein JTE90_019930 [Oedothorax gibbosus]
MSTWNIVIDQGLASSWHVTMDTKMSGPFDIFVSLFVSEHQSRRKLQILGARVKKKKRGCRNPLKTPGDTRWSQVKNDDGGT